MKSVQTKPYLTEKSLNATHLTIIARKARNLFINNCFLTNSDIKNYSYKIYILVSTTVRENDDIYLLKLHLQIPARSKNIMIIKEGAVI